MCLTSADSLIPSGHGKRKSVSPISTSTVLVREGWHDSRCWSGPVSSSLSASPACRPPRWNLSPCSSQSPPCRAPAEFRLVLEEQLKGERKTFLLRFKWKGWFHSLSCIFIIYVIWCGASSLLHPAFSSDSITSGSFYKSCCKLTTEVRIVNMKLLLANIKVSPSEAQQLHTDTHRVAPTCYLSAQS